MNEALFDACRSNDISQVEALIKSGVDVSVQNFHGYTPMYIASICGYQEIVKLLFAQKADLNIRCKFGMSILHVAVWQGKSDIVSFLITNGDRVIVTDRAKYTPLHIAIWYGSDKIARQLVIAPLVLEGATNEEKTFLNYCYKVVKSGLDGVVLKKSEAKYHIESLYAKHLQTLHQYVDMCTISNETSICLARRFGKKEIYNFLADIRYAQSYSELDESLRKQIEISYKNAVSS